ncbi:phosphatase PAP2 family protein [Shewanella sp. AS16]|uniref:phosphatase PAP2 family protein n=1 Tax=Shewanella sp. AS16 TaxID=2907625 RepID=UPI001F21A366|nr:phosphatase PAP2 family protein [Shewanella sp. AS16]MCE9687111.1 phosphatase PAP2 family protein [Shewanella sp. AS16]
MENVYPKPAMWQKNVSFSCECQPSWFAFHLGLPLMVFLLLLAWLEVFGLDMALSQWLFRLEGGVAHWPLRNVWWTDTLIHTGGRNLVILLGVTVIASLIGSYFSATMRPFRRGLWYLLASVVTTLVLVRIGKNLSHISCPWDLTDFGGKFAYSSLFEPLAPGAEFGQCFPGGHSSGGFAWIALYYFALACVPRLRWQGFALGLGMGLVFAMGQELRGAHFLSHDLTSLAIAWSVASLLYYVIFIRAARLSSRETLSLA